MAKTKSKPKAKRKPPAQRVRTEQVVSVIFPAKNCSGSEVNMKGVLEGGLIKFYEPSGYGDGQFSERAIGQGVRLDVLEAVVEKLKESL